MLRCCMYRPKYVAFSARLCYVWAASHLTLAELSERAQFLCVWLQRKRDGDGAGDWVEPRYLLVMSRYLWRMSQLLDQLPGTHLPVSASGMPL